MSEIDEEVDEVVDEPVESEDGDEPTEGDDDWEKKMDDELSEGEEDVDEASGKKSGSRDLEGFDDDFEEEDVNEPEPTRTSSAAESLLGEEDPHTVAATPPAQERARSISPAPPPVRRASREGTDFGLLGDRGRSRERGRSSERKPVARGLSSASGKSAKSVRSQASAKSRGEEGKKISRTQAAAGEVFDVMDWDDDGIAERKEIDAYLRFLVEADSDKIQQLWREVWKKAPGQDELSREQFVRTAVKAGWPIGLDVIEVKTEMPRGKPPAKLEVTVTRASSLPHADLIGSIDPYFFVAIDGKQQRTKTKMNTTSPVYEETFAFDVSERPGELSVTLWDYDRSSKDDKVGEAFVSGADMEAFLACESGAERSLELPIFKPGGGDQLQSKAKLLSTVFVVLRLTREGVVPPPPSEVIAKAPSLGGRRGGTQEDGLNLLCKVKGAAHLPKTDVFGKADAYVILHYMGQECRTLTIKYSYEPVWDETFGFRVPTGWMDIGPKMLGEEDEGFVATVYDWSRFSKDQKIGSMRVSTHELVGLLNKESKVTIERELVRKPHEEGSTFLSRTVKSMSIKSLVSSKSSMKSTEETIQGDDDHTASLSLQFSVNRASKFDTWWFKKNEQKKDFQRRAFEAEEMQVAEEEQEVEEKREEVKKALKKPKKEFNDGLGQKGDGSSWWETHPPHVDRDEEGLVLGFECKPIVGMRVVEVTVARSGGAAGTVVGVTKLPVRPQQPTFIPASKHVSDDFHDIGGKYAHRLERSYESWAVCVEWDHGTSHVYHADKTNRFNLRLLGGYRRNATKWASELTVETQVELSQEGRDWYKNNSPANCGLPGRGWVKRTFGSNCEVLWSDSSLTMRVPNRFLRPRNSKGMSVRQVEKPVVTQSKISSASGDIAIISIRCGTENSTIRYTLDRPSAPGLAAGGTASHTMPGHPGWKVYNGELRIPLETHGVEGSHDLLLKASATRRGYRESRVIGWIVQKGTPARWEQQSPLWTTPLNVYHFDTPSKFTSWPRPASAQSHLQQKRGLGHTFGVSHNSHAAFQSSFRQGSFAGRSKSRW